MFWDSFTGSARTGKLIAKAAAESNLKNVTLELGLVWIYCITDNLIT